jgi:tripartite-type tricarboxylate transporter receptor subunit TctC
MPPRAYSVAGSPSHDGHCVPPRETNNRSASERRHATMGRGPTAQEAIRGEENPMTTTTSKPARALRAAAVAMLLAAVAAAPSGARADDYPSQDIRFICGFPAGSGADVLVRYFAEKVRHAAGRTVIVENKVGAAGNIAAEYTARAKPDGYTVHVHAASAVAANQHLFKRRPFDAVKDLQIVATINQQPFMVVVPANSPYKTLAELTAAMKQKGDKASYAQSNTTGKVMGELYRQAAGITAVEVPYRTANDSINDFTGGRLDYGMMDPVFALSQARAGRLRMLAVSTPHRMKAVPELPTMTEAGTPGVEMMGWFAAMVPAGTPRPAIDKLNNWFNQVLATEETKLFLNKFGGDPFISTPEEGQALLAKQVAQWEGFVKAANIVPQ